MSNVQKRNSTIDLLRIITCFIIVLIHCRLPGMVGRVVIHFGRYGVPFFLLLTGWFSYASSDQDMINHAKRKLLDTVKLVGTFIVAYFIMNSIISLISGDMIFSWMKTYCNVDTLKNLVLFNRALFLGSTGYYPFMLIYTYIVFIILIKCNLLKKSFYFIPLFLVVNIFLGAFTSVPWFWYGNFLFTGLPFFLLGQVLRRNYSKMPKSKVLWGCLFIMGTSLALFEAFINKSAYCYSGSVLMAVSLLMLSVNYNCEIFDRERLKVMQRYSVYIFIIHCGIKDILFYFFKRLDITYPAIIFPCMVILCTLMICAIWDYIAVKMKNRKKTV